MPPRSGSCSNRFERFRYLTALSGSTFFKPPALPEVADSRAAKRIEQPRAPAAVPHCGRSPRRASHPRAARAGHRQHRMLRFEVGIGRKIARALVQALQRRPDILTHHRRAMRHRNRDVTVLHAAAPKLVPIAAGAPLPRLVQRCRRPCAVRMGSRTMDAQAMVP